MDLEGPYGFKITRHVPYRGPVEFRLMADDYEIYIGTQKDCKRVASRLANPRIFIRLHKTLKPYSGAMIEAGHRRWNGWS